MKVVLVVLAVALALVAVVGGYRIAELNEEVVELRTAQRRLDARVPQAPRDDIGAPEVAALAQIIAEVRGGQDTVRECLADILHGRNTGELTECEQVRRSSPLP